MSKSQTLRALVSERLIAAAEEIFGLFERTITEYEEELCRFKEENQRKQELLDSVLSPRVVLLGAGFQIVSTSHTQAPQMKEEPEEKSVTQEREQLPVPVPESYADCVKTEESSLPQPTQTELREETQREETHREDIRREETQREDISSVLHFYSETERDTVEHSSDPEIDEYWSPLFSCPAAQMETEAVGDRYSQVGRGTAAQNLWLSFRDSAAPETCSTVNNVNLSGIPEGAERKKHQCSMCEKRFRRKQALLQHTRIHTGEKPFSCSICNKSFTRRNNLDQHMKTHTGEKPFRCSICKKTFGRKTNLNTHIRIHTGEKPYRCSLCTQSFAHIGGLKLHLQKHTGQRPYSCPTCEKRFAQKSNLDAHVRIHTGEKPYSCSICNKPFRQSCQLTQHMKTHRTECV